MRLSLSQLFILLASWPIAYVLVPYLAGNSGVRTLHHHHVTSLQLRSAVSAAEPLLRQRPTTKADLLPNWSEPSAWIDSWERPLQILEDENGELRRDGGKLLVFSTGFDGNSDTDGNDPDDINSWDNHHRNFYNSQIAAAEQRTRLRRRIWASVLATPFVFAIIWLPLTVLIRWSTKNVG